MSCVRPLPAYRCTATQVVHVGYNPTKDGRSFEVPCGKCVGCRLDRRRAWAVRIGHEAQLYESNWFVTLTYDDGHLPSSLSLEYRHFQLFMKRLRKKIGGDVVGPEGGRPLRFFCAGEYGGRFKRPHYHAILFNLRLQDAEKMFNGRYVSRSLEKIWENGSIILDAVNARTAAYVAGYTQKKVYGSRGRESYEDVVSLRTGEVSRRRAEFAAMSLKPGIGAWWFRRFGRDLFPHDFAIVEGKRNKVPLYYWKKYREEADRSLVEEIEYGRYLRAQVQVKKGESTPERRAVRELVAEERLKLYSDRSVDGQ